MLDSGIYLLLSKLGHLAIWKLSLGSLPPPSHHPASAPTSKVSGLLLSGFKPNLKLILQEINLKILDSTLAWLDVLEIIKMCFSLTSRVPSTLRNTLNLA